MFTQNIRRQFLQYFKDRKHAVVPSSPVVPHDDPTLLFTNAGMNQFKDVFLGQSHRDYTRAATSQKCIRVGGKHNDLENVGHTSRHITFFEMLGNFSFGDYFKEDAIKFAWEVSTNVFGFDPDRIWPTVFRDDDEAFELWTKFVPANRITRFGEKENFWAMGDTGPCGPCSELLYDRGAHFGNAKNPSEDPSGERFLEYWNLVFMQYNRQPSGHKEPLPRPSIDTGAGLERVLSLKMGVDTVFETDILRSIIARIEQISGIPYDLNDKHRTPAFRVIADHLRCLSFAIADGVQPSNVDRGYVLRKVLRRAVRYGRMLGMDRPFLAEVLPQLVDTMGSDYPEIVKGQDRIAEILTNEEEAFIRTLKRGGNILNQIIEKAQVSNKMISGDDAFKLKDTYGLPIEEIALIAKDTDLTVDEKRYQELEELARERSRKVHKNVQQIAGANIFADFIKEYGDTKFLGYQEVLSPGKILAIIVDGNFVERIEDGQEGQLILDQTPFYAEMGGQIGDTGHIEGGRGQELTVESCVSAYKGIISHVGKLKNGSFQLGDSVTAIIDQERRQKIANNHTATHLLHWALHQILGEHIKQAGSVVDPTRLRFDFSHHKALTPDEIKQIEDLINNKIRENLPVKTYELLYEEVQKRDDIKQFFGEKYGTNVRVIDIDYSKELCGGTHTAFVGNIGYFRIAKESSIAAGIRRIEAVSGEEAEELARESENSLLNIANKIKSLPHQVEERIEKLLEENRQLSQELKGFKKNQLTSIIDGLVVKAEKVGSFSLLMAEIPATVEELKVCADQTMDKLKSGIVVLAMRVPDKCQVIIKVSDDLTQKGFSANDLVKLIAPIIEGSGGGKPNAAQAGGKLPQKLNEAFEEIRNQLLQKAN
ncbi:MAG: alanine--tRNA ligase [Parachlamydiaceae bacterium]|nr:alanine--tRNA ligase [Parachlamydiaceae bacterium]